MQDDQNGNVEKQRLVSMVRDFNLKLSSNDKTFANNVTSACEYRSKRHRTVYCSWWK